VGAEWLAAASVLEQQPTRKRKRKRKRPEAKKEETTPREKTTMDGGGNGGGAELTAGERRFVEAAMGARGDEVRWVAWVLKLKRDKVQDRLLVLGRYRLLSIKRSKVSGKKAV
jgi:hypothetical protein